MRNGYEEFSGRKPRFREAMKEDGEVEEEENGDNDKIRKELGSQVERKRGLNFSQGNWRLKGSYVKTLEILFR